MLKPFLNRDIRGKLGALFEYRDDTLGQARDELGRMAIGFSQALNDLQGQGFDLNGEVGKKYLYRF